MLTPSRARLAVTAIFALNGGLFGIWAARIPVFVERFDLDHDRLGLLLLCIAGGAILAFPLTGRLSDKIGAARVTKATIPAFCVAFAALAVAPSVAALAVLLALWGAFYGAMDVAMNGWGAEVERSVGRPIMTSFHAAWSLGGILGAGAAAASAWAGIGPGVLFPAAALLVGAPVLWAARGRWPSRTAAHGAAFALPRGALLLVGLMALASSIGEGSVADWSAVFLLTKPGAVEATAAFGFVAFSGAMVVMRLLGDRAIARAGPVTAARLSGLSAAAGVAWAVAAPTLFWSLPGFVLMGLGYAVIFPLAVSRAAADPDLSPGRAIAAVATLGYGGALLGPVVIGWIAAATSLPAALSLVGVLALCITLLAGAVRAP